MMKGQQKARINPYNLDPLAVCDRCGELYNRSALSYQFVFAGNALVKTGSLVCAPCLDVPFPNNRPIRTGPDPVPIADPRPAPWAEQMGSTDPTIPQVWPDGYQD